MVPESLIFDGKNHGETGSDFPIKTSLNQSSELGKLGITRKDLGFTDVFYSHFTIFYHESATAID